MTRLGKRSARAAVQPVRRKKDSRPASSPEPDPAADAAALYRQGRYRDALHSASAALRRTPNSARLWNVSAGAALALNLCDDAERFWKTAIAHDPDFPDAHYNLGVLHFQRGNLEAAARGFARTLALAPERAEALNNLGAVLAEQRRFEEAGLLLRKSIELHGANPQALHNLGLTLIELGRYPEAQACIERAISLKPHFSEALTSRASLCLHEGDEEATDRFIGAALAADPRNGRAHLIRALMAKTVTRTPWVGVLRAAYEQRANRPLKDVIDLDFAMGKVSEDLGEYDAAFSAYAEGNRLHYSRHPFDEDHDQRLLQTMIAAFGPELYEQDSHADRQSAVAADSRVPIFVVGMPRSGTTLVEQILASHPQITGGGELTTLDELLAQRPIAVPAAAERVTWLAELRALGAEYLTRVWKPEVRTRFLVDKMPSNYRYLGMLPLMIPNLRIIHVTRDPLDTCLSCFATPFAHGHEYSYDQGTLGRHYLRYRRLMDHWRAVLPPGQVFEISYEALVAGIERETHRMLEHLGLPWDERCMRFHENRRLVETASRVQVRQPLYSSSVARWKRFGAHLAPLREALAPILDAGASVT